MTRKDCLSYLQENDRSWKLKVPTSTPEGCNLFEYIHQKISSLGPGHFHVRDLPFKARRGRKCLESLVLTPGTILLVFERESTSQRHNDDGFSFSNMVEVPKNDPKLVYLNFPYPLAQFQCFFYQR